MASWLCMRARWSQREFARFAGFLTLLVKPVAHTITPTNGPAELSWDVVAVDTLSSVSASSSSGREADVLGAGRSLTPDTLWLQSAPDA